MRFLADAGISPKTVDFLLRTTDMVAPANRFFV